MQARQLVESDFKACFNKGFALKIIANPRIPRDFYANPIKMESKHSIYEDEDEFLMKFMDDYLRGNYLFTLCDGACFQLNYEFDLSRKNHSYLSKANLIFLPPIKSGTIVHEYLRFDFCNEKSEGHFFHACAHMHIGFRNTIRIPTNEVLLFSDFFKLVLYLFYPEDYQIFTGEECTYSRDKVNGCLTREKILASELEDFMHLYVAKG